MPHVVGEILLYGKETDREARLEFLITKSSDLVAKVRKLQEVGGEQLGMIEKEEKIGSTFAIDEAAGCALAFARGYCCWRFAGD